MRFFYAKKYYLVENFFINILAFHLNTYVHIYLELYFLLNETNIFLK